MKAILVNYHTHITNNNYDSMISKVYGLHKMIFYRKKIKQDKKIYFCIMNNVFCTDKKIDVRYDLKGSTQGRRTILKEGDDPTIALKDLDFMEGK